MRHLRAANYGSPLNVLLSDAQSRSEYVWRFGICVGEDGYSLSIDEGASDEKWGERPSTPKIGDDDLIVVVVPSSNPPPGATYYYSTFS